jgi:hypothetical protein
MNLKRKMIPLLDLFLLSMTSRRPSDELKLSLSNAQFSTNEGVLIRSAATTSSIVFSLGNVSRKHFSMMEFKIEIRSIWREVYSDTNNFEERIVSVFGFLAYNEKSKQ